MSLDISFGRSPKHMGGLVVLWCLEIGYLCDMSFQTQEMGSALHIVLLSNTCTGNGGTVLHMVFLSNTCTGNGGTQEMEAPRLISLCFRCLLSWSIQMQNIESFLVLKDHFNTGSRMSLVALGVW